MIITYESDQSVCFDTLRLILLVLPLLILGKFGFLTGPFPFGWLSSDTEDLNPQHICHLSPDANCKMQIINAEECQHSLDEVVLWNEINPINLEDYVDGEYQGKDQIGTNELVVLLLGHHAKLHVHGVSNH